MYGSTALKNTAAVRYLLWLSSPVLYVEFRGVGLVCSLSLLLETGSGADGQGALETLGVATNWWEVVPSAALALGGGKL